VSVDPLLQQINQYQFNQASQLIYDPRAYQAQRDALTRPSVRVSSAPLPTDNQIFANYFNAPDFASISRRADEAVGHQKAQYFIRQGTPTQAFGARLALSAEQLPAGGLPGLGEYLDFETLVGRNSSGRDRLIAAGSLLLNLATAGEAPNFSRAATHNLDEIVNLQRLTHQIDVLPDNRVFSQIDTISGTPAASTVPAWKQYQQRFGGQETPLTTTFQGQTVKVRLDKPPTGSTIVDFKDYNWNNPSYSKPFIQQKVIRDFTTQVEKYKTIRPDVHIQFSQKPPSWATQAIQSAGGTYSVVP
jgi:hypothetical protein